MKKCILLTALALTVALSACTSQPTAESAPPETATPTVAATPTPTPQPTPTPEPTPEPTPTRDPSIRPTDEEVLAAYDEASEAARWFDLVTLPVDYDSEPVGEAGEEWYLPVIDERFPTMDALRTYLKTLFSDSIVDDGMLREDQDHYKDINGRLYALDLLGGSDTSWGERTYTVTWAEDGSDRCIVETRIELIPEDENSPEGYLTFESVYEKVGNKWVFTSLNP